ncbi:MAG TPA: alpha/beta fold hydrolase [Thermodesulfobacteriota bacterium]
MIREATTEALGSPARYLEVRPPAERRPPLLLVHGFNAWADLWRPNLEGLAAAGRRVVAVDLPVHGGTPPPARAADLSVGGFVRFLLEIQERLGLAGGDVVGHSFGGLLSARLALDHPARVRRLVLVSSAGLGLAVPLRTMLAFTRLVATTQLRGVDPERTRRYVLTYVCAARPDLDESLLPLIGAGWRDPVRRRALARLGLAFLAREADVRRELPRLGSRLMLLWGAEDRLLPVALGRRAARRVPGARLVVFERCGHMPNLEWPARFTEVVTGFLDEGAAASAAAEASTRT